MYVSGSSISLRRSRSTPVHGQFSTRGQLLWRNGTIIRGYSQMTLRDHQIDSVDYCRSVFVEVTSQRVVIGESRCKITLASDLSAFQVEDNGKRDDDGGSSEHQVAVDQIIETLEENGHDAESTCGCMMARR
ncbi:hypothetical protein KCU85_g121, partial [Aureobasidium melanogenum]